MYFVDLAVFVGQYLPISWRRGADNARGTFIQALFATLLSPLIGETNSVLSFLRAYRQEVQGVSLFNGQVILLENYIFQVTGRAVSAADDPGNPGRYIMFLDLNEDEFNSLSADAPSDEQVKLRKDVEELIGMIVDIMRRYTILGNSGRVQPVFDDRPKE